MNSTPPPSVTDHPEFSALDREFADLMVRLATGSRPELALAAALVSHARSQGHVCLNLARPWEPTLTPLSCPPVAHWRAALRDASSVVGRPGDVRPLILDDRDRLYLRRFWHYEHQVAEALRQRSEVLDVGELPSTVREGLDALFPEDPGELVHWQHVAAFMALRQSLTVISGGPGTGKTSTVVRILALLLARAGGPLRIAVAAPTGKAAGRLQESLRTQRSELMSHLAAAQWLPDEATTLHRLLGSLPDSPYFRHHSGNLLPLDVLVVDEASMVDLALLAKVLDALPPTARLLLLGDKDQLASVEAGGVLGDLTACPTPNAYSAAFLDAYRCQTGRNPPAPRPTDRGASGPLGDCLVELRRNYRFGEGSRLFRVSQAVRRGDGPAVSRELSASGDGLIPRALPSPGGLAGALREPILQGFGPVLDAPDAAAALRAAGAFRLLGAVREGPWGIRRLNDLAELLLRQSGRIPNHGPWFRGRPVLITANDPDRRLFNGDLGLVWTDDAGRPVVVFAAPDGGLRRLSPARLPAHETAFALTVHKSQGSEFDSVLLVLPDPAGPVVTRELLYTGLTRARRQTELWASSASIDAAVGRPTRRESGLRERWWGRSLPGTT